MIIGPPQRLNYVQFGISMLNGVAIKRVEPFKYLGIVLDSNISWSSHIDNLFNKVSSRIGILEPIMPCLTLPSAQTVYKSTIQPLFDYCGVVWDTCSDTSSLRLQRLQNRAGRVIFLTDNCNYIHNLCLYLFVHIEHLFYWVSLLYLFISGAPGRTDCWRCSLVIIIII